ncbi:MAG: ribonuclease HII [Oscillospiraceae bacterium]|jgi:ribonuclease HII|nr:ribonuclease HII [Oscillospiraceae bacterium]
MPDYSYEKLYTEKGYGIVAGVDEAGRGPLAGDVYAAAVILPPGTVLEGLDDSKKLSEKKRLILRDKIQRLAVSFAVGTASVEEIDTLNILRASQLAMNRAIERLDPKPGICLVDGNTVKYIDFTAEPIIKGDGLSMSIAAASVLAKTYRDDYMRALHLAMPRYGFDRHKGYGTKAHYEAIRLYGASNVHRKDFLKKMGL